MVLGKYSYTDGGKSEIKNYDEREVSVTQKVYDDALSLAKEEGLGQSLLNYNNPEHFAPEPFAEMEKAIEPEDVPQIVSDVVIPSMLPENLSSTFLTTPSSKQAP